MTENHFLSQITFEKVPQAMEYLISKVEKLESLMKEKQSPKIEGDIWLNLNALCEYHPDRPAKPTVYAWVGQRSIPYHKKGKKLMFLRSEIDCWLKEGRRKTNAEIQAEAVEFVAHQRGGRK